MTPRGPVTMYFSIVSCFLLSTPHAAVVESRLAPEGSFDQKQTGEYNIRLHLKDFQIIALLSEDALGALNDDYEDLDYHIPEEYLDVPFPIAQNSTSTAATSTTPPSSTTETTEATRPSTTSTTLQPRRTVTSRVTTRKSEIITKPISSSTTTTTITTKPKPLESSVIKREGEESVKKNATTTLDKIPVVIMQEKSNRNVNNSTKKIVSTSVTIVPPSRDSGGVGSVSQVMLGEILHYKKCPDGYSRDKMGRCRKTRRPPFDISRFTSNLASRFKRPSSTEKYEK